MRSAIVLFAALVLACVAGQARSAETYSTCTGFIASVPASISTGGVWCMRKDLATSATSGAAITIAANNVTIDCNNFKLGGLGAGAGSLASGIKAIDRQNATVRNCSVRGFYKGIDLDGGAALLVEDNRLDNNLQVGIFAVGDSGMVRRNQVFDTGGAVPVTLVMDNTYLPNVAASPIAAYNMHILDNLVQGTFGPAGGNYHVYGVVGIGYGIAVRDNLISGLSSSATSGYLTGIGMPFSYGMVRNNLVKMSIAPAAIVTVGVSAGNESSQCMGNYVRSFTTPFDRCVQP